MKYSELPANSEFLPTCAAQSRRENLYSTFNLHRSTFRNGFTLIELLVVMVIIGILITFASLAIGNNQDALVQEEARRIAALLDLAGDDATLQGLEIGVQFTRDGYRFMFIAQPEPNAKQEDKEPNWVPVNDDNDRMLRPRQLHPAITMQLLLDGLPQRLPDEPPEHGKPQLLLSASGERTPFVLRLSADNGRIVYELEGLPIGPIKQRNAPRV